MQITINPLKVSRVNAHPVINKAEYIRDCVVDKDLDLRAISGTFLYRYDATIRTELTARFL